MLNSRNFRTGIRLVGVGTLTGSVLGDLQTYTVDGQLYYNDGTANQVVLTGSSSNVITNKKLDDTTVYFIDTSDSTKQFHFDAAGSTGTQTTLATSQTANRVITLPDATDTLVGRATTDTLINKSIDGSTNTLTNISLTSSVIGVLPLINGGTGTAAASANAAFNALSPMTTGGDLIYGGTSGAATRLANGSSGQVLTSSGTTLAPTWTTPSPGFINPMTSVGDIIIGGVAGAATRLAASTNGFILTLVSGSPAWQANSGGGGTVTSVTASSPLASSGGTTPNITLNSAVGPALGGTGVANNAASTLTISGNFATTLTVSASTSVTLPTSGTLSTLSGTETLSNKTFSDAVTFNQISTPSNPAATKDKLYFKNDDVVYTLNSSGVETALTNATPIIRSEVCVTVGNGSGVVNTFIRRWTNSTNGVNGAVNTGTAITYADDALLGATFTINEDGIYSISYSNSETLSSQFGISLNQTIGTQAFSQLPLSEQVMGSQTPSANAGGTTSRTLFLSSGSIIRGTWGNAGEGPDYYQKFSITKVNY